MTTPGTIEYWKMVERDRCKKLVEKLARGKDRDFLIHCIEYAVAPSEIEGRRQRFKEMQPREKDPWE